jgi:L-glutamine-phosphate cytidylyltransferase
MNTGEPVTQAVTQAVVLAAGRGSRLGALTDTVPKCLLPLAGQPVLAWTVAALRRAGISRIRVIGGWQADALAAHGVDVAVNPRWNETSMLRSLQVADDWLRAAPTLVVYGDGAYSADVIEHTLRAPAADILVPGDRRWHELWSLRFDDPLDDAECWQHTGHRLQAIGGRPRDLDEVQAQFMGLVRLSTRGWQCISDAISRWELESGAAAVDRLDMTAALARLLGEGQPLHCELLDGGWVEIDSLRDLQAVETALQQPGWSHDFRR